MIFQRINITHIPKSMICIPLRYSELLTWEDEFYGHER